MIVMTLKDRIFNTDKLAKTANSIISNTITLNLDEETNICIISRVTEFINAQEFADTILSKVEISIPVLFSDKDIDKFWNFYNALSSNEEYHFAEDYNFNSRYRYVEIYLDNGEKYLVPSNDRFLTKLSDMYSSEIQKYLRADRFKYK